MPSNPYREPTILLSHHERLSRLARILERGDEIDVRTLAHMLRVGVRTVQRDLQLIPQFTGRTLNRRDDTKPPRYRLAP